MLVYIVALGMMEGIEALSLNSRINPSVVIMKWSLIQKRGLSLVKLALKNAHNRILTCGVLIGLCFLPIWLGITVRLTIDGASAPLLNLGFLYLGIQILWQQRHQLSLLTVHEDERLVGYFMIIGGVIAFPFCLASSSLQALLCMVILLGSFYCSWGFDFFKKFFLAIGFILIGLYPDLSFISNAVWRILTPHNLLENLMAWLGSMGLRAINQPAVSVGAFISIDPNLPLNPTLQSLVSSKTVEVASGCSGFDMAFTLAGSSIIFGVLLKQTWPRVLAMMGIGIALALVLNVPRVMLVAVAAIHWGHDSFEFWHGAWGGQIFATILFTIYYYLVMGLVSQKSKKSAV